MKYLGCMLDETISGETMALSFINKINNKLKFLYRKNRFLTQTLRQLSCNALILHPHFDYACSTWYLNLTKKLKTGIQTSPSKCIRFCLQLEKMTHISHKNLKLWTVYPWLKDINISTLFFLITWIFNALII